MKKNNSWILKGGRIIDPAKHIDHIGDLWIRDGRIVEPGSFDASLAETVKRIPLDRIVLETDAPYLTPTPHRGERNESAYIPLVAAFLAQQKGVSLEEVAATTTENAKRLFAI